MPWAALEQAVRAIFNAKLVRVEANAATNEARIAKVGPKLTRTGSTPLTPLKSS